MQKKEKIFRYLLRLTLDDVNDDDEEEEKRKNFALTVVNE